MRRPDPLPASSPPPERGDGDASIEVAGRRPSRSGRRRTARAQETVAAPTPAAQSTAQSAPRSAPQNAPGSGSQSAPRSGSQSAPRGGPQSAPRSASQSAPRGASGAEDAPSAPERARRGRTDADPAAPASSRSPAPGVPDGSETATAPDGPLKPAAVWRAARARRRALRAEMRRFTARSRRRRAVWIAALGSVLVLVLAAFGIAYSPLSAVQRIDVVGAHALDVAAVEEALAAQVGTPLPLVDRGEVEAALGTFPLIESYTLEARPPHDLIVRVVERTPVGSMAADGGYVLLDAAGVVLSTGAEQSPGLPLIRVSGGRESGAFHAVATVFRALPPGIAAQVTEMTATTANDVTLWLGDLQVVWGSADRSEDKASSLGALMIASPPTETTVYDVTSPDAVVVR